MKFLTDKKLTQLANQLYEKQLEIKEAEVQLQILKAEKEKLETFLQTKAKDGGFQFNGKEGLMQLVINTYSRKILNQGKAKLLLERNGLKVPMQSSTITQVKVDYVYEEE